MRCDRSNRSIASTGGRVWSLYACVCALVSDIWAGVSGCTFLSECERVCECVRVWLMPGRQIRVSGSSISAYGAGLGWIGRAGGRHLCRNLNVDRVVVAAFKVPARSQRADRFLRFVRVCVSVSPTTTDHHWPIPPPVLNFCAAATPGSASKAVHLMGDEFVHKSVNRKYRK